MQSIKRILLSRMKFIGDVVLTTPVIRAVREQFPEAYIAYLGDKEAVSLLEGNPCLNEIIPYDFSKPSLFESPRVIFQLRKRKFDAVVDLFSNPRTALLMYASGAPIRIGKKSEGRGNLYTHQIEDDGKPKSAIQFHYQYVKPLGVEPTQFNTEIFLTDIEKREAKRFLQWQFESDESCAPQSYAQQPIIGINPGATWPAKIWLRERFAGLAFLLTKHLNARVVLFQGPKDKTLAEEVAKLSLANVSVLPVMQLRQLAAALSQLSLYITNDNGTMHIAVATGTTTIGIFGPGEENIWFPYSPPHLALRKNVPCHPCHLDFCNLPGDEYMKCMKKLSVDEVFLEVKKRLLVDG
ncbi:MAG: glycosyltransferase family 9 protein [Bacteroidetes bacterium]|nr:MAG: glycosyltransferase family 9 protein [Bacteroidota bacterium]